MSHFFFSWSDYPRVLIWNNSDHRNPILTILNIFASKLGSNELVYFFARAQFVLYVDGKKSEGHRLMKNLFFHEIFDCCDLELRDLKKHVFRKNMTFWFFAIDEKNDLYTSKNKKFIEPQLRHKNYSKSTKSTSNWFKLRFWDNQTVRKRTVASKGRVTWWKTWVFGVQRVGKMSLQALGSLGYCEAWRGYWEAWRGLDGGWMGLDGVGFYHRKLMFFNV